MRRVGMAGFHAGRVVGFLIVAACAAIGQQRDAGILPDAPSAQGASEVGADVSVIERAGWQALYREPVEQNSGDFFQKHLNPSVVRRSMSYHPSASSSLVGRATYAASRVLITRDETGKGRLNTSYFLTVLTSAVVHTAYRPYWNRSVGAPFSDFGSTIGNDAGMNVLHEFGPGLQQLVKSHTPRFVARIEERVGR